MGIRLRGAGRAGRTTAGAAVLATLVGLGLGAAPASSQAATAKPVVVGFGDSVPAGLHCGCPTFVQQYATKIGGTAQNLARSGSTSLNLVHLLQTARAWNAVKQASVVVVMTGANDYTSAFYAVAGGASTSTYNSVARQVRSNVTTAVNRIRYINPNAHVVIVDYWAALEAGKVAAQDYNSATRRAASAATKSVNDALWAVSQSMHTEWLSTYQVFRKAGTDVTSLLLPDGNHPDATGTALIADALTILSV